MALARGLPHRGEPSGKDRRLLEREARDRRQAARQGRPRAAFIGVDGVVAHVHVGIDAARNDKQARGIQFPGAGARFQVFADVNDETAADTHVGVIATFRGHDRAVANDDLCGLLAPGRNRDPEENKESYQVGVHELTHGETSEIGSFR